MPHTRLSLINGPNACSLLLRPRSHTHRHAHVSFESIDPIPTTDRQAGERTGRRAISPSIDRVTRIVMSGSASASAAAFVRLEAPRRLPLDGHDQVCRSDPPMQAVNGRQHIRGSIGRA